MFSVATAQILTKKAQIEIRKDGDCFFSELKTVPEYPKR